MRFLLLSLSAAIASAAANISLASLFQGDSVVLQSGPVGARVWGNATPGAHVNLSLDGAPAGAAVTDSLGRWEALLPPQPPSFRVRTLRVEDAAGGGGAPPAVAALRFGFVLLCSGQSKCVSRPPPPRAARKCSHPSCPPPPSPSPAAWS